MRGDPSYKFNAKLNPDTFLKANGGGLLSFEFDGNIYLYKYSYLQRDVLFESQIDLTRLFMNL